MNSSTLHPFSHRYSNDSIESICTQCFFTVARARRETDLERFESEHVCDPVMMGLFERAGLLAAQSERHGREQRLLDRGRRLSEIRSDWYHVSSGESLANKKFTVSDMALMWFADRTRSSSQICL